MRRSFSVLLAAGLSLSIVAANAQTAAPRGDARSGKDLRNPPRARNMAPYTAKVMTDAQAADLWAYIKTFPPASEAMDIPLLKQLMNDQK